MIRHRRRLARARAARSAGEFAAARRILEPVAGERAVVRAIAELDYLLGDYAAAEARLEGLRRPRARDRAALALIRYRTGRFDHAPKVDLPLVRLMRAWGDGPLYRLDWRGEPCACLPFTRSEPWELPTVEIEIEGRAVEAWIDTGGDMLTVPHELGVEPIAKFSGAEYAGGARGDGAYGRVDHVRLGPLIVHGVPVMTAGLDRPVIGTSFLSRLLPTLDYPAGRFILRPPGAEAPGSSARPAGAITRDAEFASPLADAVVGVEIPFALASTHLMLVRGSLDGRDDLTFLVDSGLRDEPGAAFIAPAATLSAAGIAIPDTAPETGNSGAGETTLDIGRFAIRGLGVGPLLQHDVIGMYGAFPPQLTGLGVHGLVSHHFLRRYRWTIDFARMTMRFATEGEAAARP